MGKNGITFTFTYDKVTPESAEQGDTSDNGFYDPDGAREYSLRVPEIEANVRKNPKDYHVQWKPGELRHALKTARDLGCCSEDSGRWFSSGDPDIDYRTGEDTRYAFHIDGVTPSTYRRIGARC